MMFTITNKLIFIEGFHFLLSSLGSLINNLGKDDFQYSSQKIDNKVLDLDMQKGFYPYEYISDSEKFKE